MSADRENDPTVLAADYPALLSANDQVATADRPLLTEAGVRSLQRVLAAVRAERYGGPACRPRWIPGGRTLFLGDVEMRAFSQDGSYQTAILAAFEAAGWPPAIGDPLSRDPGGSAAEARRRLHDAVKNLCRGLLEGTIRFYMDGKRVWRARCG